MSLLIASSKLEIWWSVPLLHGFSQMLGHDCEIDWKSVGEFDWMTTMFVATLKGVVPFSLALLVFPVIRVFSANT